MNLSLLDPFALAQEYPESQSVTLQYGQSGCIKFNHTGDYLASGLVDGSIAIFDSDTNGVLLVLRGHSRPVQSISWSHDGRYLLSSSRDWKCILWDLKSPTTTTAGGGSGGITKYHHHSNKRVFNFETPVWSAYLHPTDSTKFVVSLFEDNARYVEIDDPAAATGLMTTPPSAPRAPRILSLPSSATPGKSENALVTIFSASGDYILVGTSKGNINVIKTGTTQIVHSTRISSSNIKNMVMSGNGRFLVVNSSDRVVRFVSLPRALAEPASVKHEAQAKEKEVQEEKKEEGMKGPEDADAEEEAKAKAEAEETAEAEGDDKTDDTTWNFEIEHKFQDVVNRLQWNAISISPTAEYVLASTFEAAHDIYMWETSMGSLVKIYEGPKEELVDVEWHPSRPVVAATGLDSGKIYLWTSIVPQRWSALAPDFIEVEENVEYLEREDEFDVEDETEQNQRQLDDEDEEVVDIMTVDASILKERAWFSIPVSLDLEDEDSASDNDE